MAMRESLALTEDQHALLQSVHGVLTDQLAAGGLRKSLDHSCGFSPELHGCLTAELGLAGLTVPEEFGGRGLSQVEASVVHTELGRALYPGPILPTHLAAAALMAAGDRQAREHWLPLLASGSVTGTVAAADEAGHWSAGPGGVKAEHATGGWRLYGRRWFVMAAHAAGIIVVPAVTESGLAMFLAEAAVQRPDRVPAAEPGPDQADQHHDVRRGARRAGRQGRRCGAGQDRARVPAGHRRGSGQAASAGAWTRASPTPRSGSSPTTRRTHSRR